MKPNALEEDLGHSINFALKCARPYKPKTYDRDGIDHYYKGVAEDIIKHLKMSGWTVEPSQVLRKHISRGFEAPP